MENRTLEEFFGNRYKEEFFGNRYKEGLNASVEKELLPPTLEAKRDLVNNPPHYTSHPSGIECITVTEHYNFCIGNAIKYLWRAGLKRDSFDPKLKQIQDLEKAVWYINREIHNLKSDSYE